MSNEYPPQFHQPYPITELSPTIEAPPPPAPRRRWLHYGANIALGAGVLLTGVPLAWLLGIGAARVISAPAQTMPLQERLLRRTSRIITEIHRLPSRWQPAPPLETRIEPIPIPTQPVEPLVTPAAVLSDRDRQIAEEELVALQQEFETIQTRLFDLESKLGQAQSTADVESRLANLNQWLNPNAAVAQTPAAPLATPKQKPPRQSPLLETTELKITLPSDALFAPGEARLLATAPELLNSIFEDLNQYPNATILIGSHTDDSLETDQSSSLAFQQANALRAYLIGNLPEHRWVTVGYGQNQPITDNSTPQLRQRNRRVEIAIDRR